MPVVMQGSLVQTVQRLVTAPQVQFLARLWMCLSLCNDRCLVFVVPKFCSSVMDVAVNMQRHGVSRQSSASDSVHRRSLWTFPFATETCMHSWSCAWRALFGRHGGGDEGSLLQFCSDEARRDLRALLGMPAPRRTAEQVERHRACMAVTVRRTKGRGRRGGRKRLLEPLHTPCVAVLVVDFDSCMILAGFTGGMQVVLCSILSLTGPGRSASWLV